LKFVRFLSNHGINDPFRVYRGRNRWRTQNFDSRDRNPKLYTNNDRCTEEIFKDVLPMLPRESSILEVGCNCGRMLHYLHGKGYGNLTGIEIGRQAIELMREVHPEVYETARILEGDAVKKLRELETNAFDLVYTRGVLVNISDNRIFHEMARVCRGYILNFESEGSYLAYPRDFPRMYEKVGYKMIICRSYAWNEDQMCFPRSFGYAELMHNSTIRLYVPYKKARHGEF
jgi:SAM-dependent methyltransferase